MITQEVPAQPQPGFPSKSRGRSLLIGLLIVAATVLGLWFLYDHAAVASHVGDATVFQYRHWVPYLFAGAGVLILLFGIYSVVGRGKPVLYAVGGLLPAAVLIVVSTVLKNDRITVEPQSFTVRSGLFWNPWTRSVDFADLSEIKVYSREVTTGKTTSRETFLDCVLKSGGTETFEVSELMSMGAKDAILAAAGKSGVPVAVAVAQ